MLYFFEKSREFLQYEVQETDVPEVFAIVATYPDGLTRTEYVTGETELKSRWKSIEDVLQKEGWSGPHGRDL